MIDNGNPHANGNGAGHGVAELVAPPAEADPSPETLLFRTGLLSPDQLGELVQERVGSGRSVEEIVVERGWLDAETVARALGQEAAAPAVPAAVPAPAPVAEPHPDPFAIPVVEPTPEPQPELHQPLVAEPVVAEPAIAAFAPVAESVAAEPVAVEPVVVELPVQAAAAAVEFRVSIRFAGNDCVEVASHADAADAKAAAQVLVAQLSQGAEWPFVAGRFVRPEAVLSVDVDAVVR